MGYLVIKVFNLKIATEIAIVFAVLLSVKEIADNMAITGAGAIAMWSGIIVPYKPDHTQQHQ